MTSRPSRTALALLIAGALLLASCASKPTLLELKPPPVKLANCQANPDDVTVHYTQGDMVTWNADEQGYTVTFPSTISPFANASISVPANGSASSGPVSLGAKACVLANTMVTLSSGSCYYTYTVKGDKGCASDPGVIIQK
jgi:hypothetical protein